MRSWLPLPVLLVLSACSSGTPASSSSFPAAAALTLTGDEGRLDISLWTAPAQPPQRGDNSVKLLVTSASTGAPVDGLTVSVVPWMPAMDHGTSVPPTVTPEGGGVYIVDHVSFFMAGEWELRTTFSDSVNDRVEPTFDVP
jgi:YtkA-like protein